MVAGAEFKRQVPPIAKLGPRTAGRRLPVPAAPARLGPTLSVAVPPRGTLYVVATPIGNLGDVTLRALEVLRAVPLIAAEDTRVTRRLLDRYEVGARTVSYHARSGPARERELLAHLEGGADLALVTDAGTPVVSDPGEGLVAAWAAAGGTRRAHPGRLVRARRGGRQRRDGAALVVRGVPAAIAAANAGSGWRGSPPTSAGTVLFEAPGRLRGDAARPRRGLRRRPPAAPSAAS